MKISRTRASMIPALSFFIENVYNRSNGTMIHQHFVTWRSRLATTPDTLTCIVLHGGQFTGGVYPQISSSLRLLVLSLVCPHLFVIHYRLFIFSKNFLSSAPLTNATPAFSKPSFFLQDNVDLKVIQLIIKPFVLLPNLANKTKNVSKNGW